MQNFLVKDPKSVSYVATFLPLQICQWDACCINTVYTNKYINNSNDNEIRNGGMLERK